MQDYVIMTNNPLVWEKLSAEHSVEYYESDFKGVLTEIRNQIYLGKKLLSHPLSGSIKPNETPYKSVLITSKTQEIDVQSVKLIESAIAATDKFQFKPEESDSKSLQDMQLIDFTLLSSALASADV